MNDIYQKLKTTLQPYHFFTSFDQERKLIFIKNNVTGRHIEIDLNKFTKRSTDSIDELTHYIINALQADTPTTIANQTDAILPVIRAKSFPATSNTGIKFVLKEHTTETNIYYALNMPTTYHLITENMLVGTNFSVQLLHECALNNLKKIVLKSKQETIANNEFYFIHLNDGYDAARILIIDEIVTNFLKGSLKGQVFVAIPHHDILIIGNIFNNNGIDILGHIAMDYFMNGNIPLTNLVFNYEQGQLNPHFILPKTKIKN